MGNLTRALLPEAIAKPRKATALGLDLQSSTATKEEAGAEERSVSASVEDIKLSTVPFQHPSLRTRQLQHQKSVPSQALRGVDNHVLPSQPPFESSSLTS